MPKKAATGTVALFDPGNRKVHEESYSTDDARTVAFEAAQASKGVYRLEITDDMRAIWDVKSTLPKMVIAMRPAGSIAGGGGRGGRRCYFFVPPGTREFKVGFGAGHAGTYAGAVQTPEGTMAGSTSFVHPDPKVQEPMWIVVKPDEGQTGKTWSFAFAGPGDISVWLEGAPGFYALAPEAVFIPEGQ
jgi:hypothetical protein